MFQEHTIRALHWIVSELNHRDIPYQISGGFAAKLYGSPRPLNDIDIDIPDAAFAEIAPVLRPYLSYGPARYVDAKWDILLMTAEYGVQEIDVSGGTSARMTSKGDIEWLESPCDFSRTLRMPFEGIELSVIHPTDLAAYKSHLNGEHQAHDIAAACAYAHRIDPNASISLAK